MSGSNRRQWLGSSLQSSRGYLWLSDLDSIQVRQVGQVFLNAGEQIGCSCWLCQQIIGSILIPDLPLIRELCVDTGQKDYFGCGR